MNTLWKKVESKSLPNLHVLTVDNREVGLIYRPHNTNTDKNSWRCYIGIGEKSKFIDHRWNKKDAKSLVLNTYENDN